MDDMELAKTLRRMYEQAGDGQKVAMIHLFGIKYCDEIRRCGTSPANLVLMAGLRGSYGTEVNKGCNLAHFVEIKRGLP